MKFWLALLLVSGLRTCLASRLPLFGDEAFYAWEALHPAWMYSDLPPITAMMTLLGTMLGGDTALALRLPTLIIGALIPIWVVRIARHVGTVEQAWRAGLLAMPLPLLQAAGLLALPDAPLTLAALGCLDALLMLRERVSWPACVQLALALVVGALSHYRFAPLLLGGLLAVVLAGDLPRLLRSGRVWAALGLGALAWVPLLHYNLQGEADGARFQLVDRHPWAFDAEGLAQPILQAIITTPVFYVLCIWAGWQVLRRWSALASAQRLLGVAALFPFLLYAVAAPFADGLRFSLHWPLPAYLVFAALMPGLLDSRCGEIHARWAERAAQGLAWLGGLAVLAALMVPAHPALAARVAGTSSYPDNFVGWREIGSAMAERLKPGEALVADHFMLAAQLSFQLRRRPVVYSLDHYNNHKHGRARQLADWGYDETGIASLPAGTPAWLVFEVEETPAGQRQAWVERTCRWFGGITPEAVVMGPGDGKRFWVFRGVRGNAPNPIREVPGLPAVRCGSVN